MMESNEENKPARRVPNGQVYRQIFEAQAQLVQSLEVRAEDDDAVLAGSREGQVPPSRMEGIPLVREGAAERCGGMLTHRQRTWIEADTNDPYTENPVFHRQVAELVSYKVDDDGDIREEGQEVQALPDLIIPAKMGSNIIDRIAESRRQRHEASVEDMYQELAVISAEMEPRVEEAGERLMEKLEDNDTVIKAIWRKIEKDEDLLLMDRDDLYNLWVEIQDQSVVMRQWIEELDQELDSMEADRVRMIRDIFSSYSETLGKIAHLRIPDLQRFLDTESQSVNQAILSNRRGYSDLYTRLMVLDIEREKRHYTTWCGRVQDWKRLKTHEAVDSFKRYMESPGITHPAGVENVLCLMRTELGGLNQRRLNQMATLRDMKPPQSTKTSVYQWNQSILDMCQQIETRGQHYLQLLHKEYEAVCEKGLDRVDLMKTELIEAGVCTDEQAKQAITEHCIPVIGQRQKLCEENLENMDRRMEAINQRTMGELQSLFRFAQGAAHVWDQHEVGMAKQERNLVEKLENARRQHDAQNQEKETQLDIIMDRMRQDATEPSLRDDLKKALDTLEKIKDTYHTFHKEQTDVVNHYPDSVKRELLYFDDNVCRFFGVDRAKRQKPVVLVEGEEEGKKKKKGKEKAPEDGPLSPEVPSPTKPSAVAEVLSTAKGTSYYVLTEAGEHCPPETPEQSEDDTEDEPELKKPKPEKKKAKPGIKAPEKEVFLTETAPLEEKDDDPNLACIKAESSEFIDLKKKIRMNFLEHLDTWPDSSLEKARALTACKIEELKSELDLRLHLHQPRPRRAEMDIHNVRAAELIMHSERVTRHCKGINQAVMELKQRFTNLSEQHDQLLEQYRQDVESLDTIFSNATKSSKLVALSNRLVDDRDKFMQTVRTSLRHFRQAIDDTLQMLRDSNARFLKSFKLFSDGGNFSPEEIDDYRKRLEKMAQLIDSSEGSLMEDLEGMESKRLEQATKISHEFEDRFKNHMVDLIFVEKITRWMTNTQVKIKAEVAFSNSMTGTIVNYIKQLETRIDACDKPSFDKEKITSGELYDSLKDIVEAFNDRSAYLDCLVDWSTPQSPMQGAPAVAVPRVGFTSDVTPVSKAGMKQPVEDPSVNVIKNILKTQKVNKLKAGFDEKQEAEKDTDAKTSRSQGTSRTPTEPTGALGGDKATRSYVRPSRAGASSSMEGHGKRLTSGGRRTIGKSKVDKKYFVFGEDPDEGEDQPNHFLAKIRKICRDALEGLLTSAETYYRHKGSRPVTRPELLQEAFDPCAELIVQKLQSYFNQAEEYHNQCLQEFRKHIEKFEKVAADVPPLVMRELTKEFIQKIDVSMAELDKQFEEGKVDFEKQKQEHHTLLRPNLGHPQMAEALLTLVDKEGRRTTNYLQRVEEYAQQLRDALQQNTQEYVQALAKLSEKTLLELDSILVVDDIDRGRVAAAKYPTSELIRRKMAGENLEDDEYKPQPRQKKTWPGVPRNELYTGEKPAKLYRTAGVTTAKVTQAHGALVESRDKSYQEYKHRFQETLKNINGRQNNLIVEEERWKDNWLTWVAKVKLLY